MKIIIRADSGTIMGSGHIMRCLVLADELKKGLGVREQGSDKDATLPCTLNPKPFLSFACRNLSGNIISIIESRGYAVKTLPESLIEANKEFIGFLKNEQPEILLIDHYDTDIELESKARKHAQKIVVIDDLADRKHDCDMLLDQNPCPTTHARYNNLVPHSAIKLLGLNFALLGKEFSNNTHSSLESDSVLTNNDNSESLKSANSSGDAKLKNIMIFFGGGDHKNLTEKVLSSLSLEGESWGEGVSYNIVVGSSNPNKDKIRALCEAQQNFTFHCQINNMAELMRQSDLFIGAGGTTSWERMCTSLPAIIFSIAENQIESCNELAKLDLIKYLGTSEEFTPQKLLDTLNWIEKNPDWLYNTAKLGQKMVDGKGAKRFVANINSLCISFKKAGDNDCENIFNWRNSDENRRYSINNNEISFAEHKKWFSQTINNQNRNLLIAYHNNQPLGVVRFDYAENGAEISLYLVPNQHSKGFGLPLLFAAEYWIKNNQPDISQINAKVLFANTASKKIFGYALYNEVESDKNMILFNKRLK